MRRAPALYLLFANACAFSGSAMRESASSDSDSAIAGLAGTRLGGIELRGVEVVIFERNARGFGQGRESFDLLISGKAAWEAECESIWEHAVTPPARISCLLDAVTSSVASIRLAMTASGRDKFTGHILSGDHRFAIEGATTWRIKTSTGGPIIAEIEPLPELSAAFSPELEPRDRRTLTAVALALEVMRDPRSAFRPTKSAQLTPQPLAARTATRSTTWHELGRPDLAGAIATLEEHLRYERVKKTVADPWQTYDAPEAWAVGFGVGAQFLAPFDDPSSATTLGRTNAGAFNMHLAADLGRRLELAFEVALGGRALDTIELSRKLGARGTVDTLSNYLDRDSSTGLSGASAMWIHFALRYALTDTPLRPYAGLIAGWRYEPLLFKSDDYRAACVPSETRDIFCGASQGYAIESPSSAWSFGPLLGLRYPLFHSERFGLEFRLEAQGHTTLWNEVKLRFDGDLTPESLQTHARWNSLDYGGTTFDLIILSAIDVRIRF